MSPPPLSRRATLLRPSPLWWVGGGALLAGLLAFVAVAAAGQPAHAVWGLLHGSWLLAVMIGFATMVAHRHGRRRSRGTVRIDPQGLQWNDALLVRHQDLRDALAYSNGEGRDERHGVRLRTRQGVVYIELDTRAEADALVSDLGLGAGTTAVGFAGQMSFMVLLGPVFNMGNSFILHCAAVTLLVPLMIARNRGTIGSDGVWFRRPFRRPRFVPYREISGVEAAGSAVRVTRRDGTVETLRSVDDSKTGFGPVAGARALAERIELEKQRAGTRNEDTGALGSLLARGGRPADVWLREIRGIDDEHATLRGPAVARERVWQTVENANEPAEIRAAAAALLRARADEPDRQRLRVAAAACAAPRLRIALETAAAADLDDAALAEALASCDDEPAARRRLP